MRDDHLPRTTPPALASVLDCWIDDHPGQESLVDVVRVITEVGARLATIVAVGPLEAAHAKGSPGSSTNASGDVQKPLDVQAEELFLVALAGCDVVAVCSEESEELIPLNAGGGFMVAIDPVDGSSNIDTNAPIGTIFSVLPATGFGDDPAAALLQSGRHQLAAGMIVFGPSTVLALTLGEGTDIYVLDPQSRAFLVARRHVELPADSNEYAPNGILVERDKMDKYGRPLLGATIKPKLGLSAKNYGRAVYECLRGGLDYTKDDENVNSQPFMRWRDRFESVADAVKTAQAETGERKGHYLNVTAGSVENMFERAEFAKRLGMPIIMHDFLTAGFTANTSLANWCRNNGMLLHIHRAMHAVLDRNPNHGIHFRVLTKALRLSGGDHLHSGTVVGKLEGDRMATLGWIDLMRESYIEEDRSRGLFFDQDFGHMPGLFPVASGGIHVWHIPALVSIFGDDSVLQFGGGTLGHPWGNAAGATANRTAVEACVQARNEGRDVEKEARAVLAEAARNSPELAVAMDTWKEVRFNYDVVDKLATTDEHTTS